MFHETRKQIDLALILGFGGAHVLIENSSKYAYSPNAAFLTTYNVNETTHLTVMGRYVNLAIPTAVKGSNSTFVNIAGVSLGLKKDIRPNIALLPEIGAYWYDGQVAGVDKSGPGFQYGLMLATSF